MLALPVLTIPFCASAVPTSVPTVPGGEGNYTVESSSPRQALPEPEPALTVIILIMYRTLGGLLPARYQVDRRSVRYVLLFTLREQWWKEAGWTGSHRVCSVATVWFPACPCHGITMLHVS